MSDTLLLALISAGVALLTSISSTAVMFWTQSRKVQADEKKSSLDGASVLTEANIKLLQTQQAQYDRDIKELRNTVDDQAETIQRQRTDLDMLRREYFDFRQMHDREMEKRDIEKAILLRQVADAKKAYDEFRDWAGRLRVQVENSGQVPVPFKVRDTGADVIMDP